MINLTSSQRKHFKGDTIWELHQTKKLLNRKSNKQANKKTPTKQRDNQLNGRRHLQMIPPIRS